MTLTILLDTVSGAVAADRVVLGFALASVVILIEAFVLYKLGWSMDMATSSDDLSDSTMTVHNQRNQFIMCLRDSFLANIASTLVGWLLVQYLLFMYFWSVEFWVTAFLTTIIVEALVLWGLRRKPLGRTFKVSLEINVVSYFLLALGFGLAYQMGLASNF